MLRRTSTPRLFIPVVLLIFTFGLTSLATAGEFTREFTIDADQFQLINLIGEIQLVASDGDDIEILIEVSGDDADEDLIEIEVNEGRRAEVAILFPIGEERNYVYPKLGRGSRTTINMSSDHGDHGDTGSWLHKLFGGLHGQQIKVSGKGSGLEVWADVLIRVPDGKDVKVRHGVGVIEAEGITGDLFLDINSGPVYARDIKGDLTADTGSGSVELRNITGNCTADTGSGSVEIFGFTGKELLVDTGSGSVTVDEIDCDRLLIDTGSGGVRAKGVKANSAKIDTGSGSVKLFLDRMGDGRFVVDTGSGSITLVLPADASAEVVADTGSGSITVDVEDVDFHKRKRDHMEFTIGDGDARVTLDAGSGSIRVRQ
ncbi:MAG: DUF4097 family beta strand repeat-containing protein [bacterium]